MINKEDAENLDKLLRLVKASKDYETCDISYNVKLGWSIVIIGDIGYVDDPMEAITYKKKKTWRCLFRSYM